MWSQSACDVTQASCCQLRRMARGFHEEKVRKEFLAAMQAKGKLPRFVTDASERYDKSYYETAPRIFPGPGGMRTVVDKMLKQTEARIDAAHQDVDSGTNLLSSLQHTGLRSHELYDSGVFSNTAAAAAALKAGQQVQSQKKVPTRKWDADRHALKIHLARVDGQLRAERTQRLETEAALQRELTQLEDSHLARNDRQGTGGTLQERMQAQGRLPPHSRSHATAQQHEGAANKQHAAALAHNSSKHPHLESAVHEQLGICTDRLGSQSQSSQKTRRLLERQAALEKALLKEKTNRLRVEQLLAIANATPLANGARSQYFVEASQLKTKTGQSLADWQQEAMQNVTLWRNNLFMKTMLITRQLHEARVRGQRASRSSRHLQGRHLQGSHEHLFAEHPRGAHAMFQLSNPFITCPPPGTITKVGGAVATFLTGTAEDGQKYLCNIDHLKEGCAVFSIGSRGDTSFEEAILKTTPCTVITLDCTMSKPLVTLGDRHKFYPYCLGSTEQSQANPAFITLPQLMQTIGMQRVDILKMDIEGFEWDVLASLGTEPGSESSLPTQLAIEFHVTAGAIYKNSPSHLNREDFNNLLWPLHTPTFAQFQLLMLHIIDLGYGITSRDDNPLSMSCTEIVFHRVDAANTRQEL